MAIREVALGGLTREQLLGMHYQMVLIRRFEDKAAEEYSLGRIGGFLHLYIGQEASGMGVISALRPEDYVVSSYREHGHAILKGMEPTRVMAELLGKATGMQQGQGRLDAHVQRRAQPHRRPGHRRRTARHRHGPWLRHPVSGGEARRRLALRRWRGGRGRDSTSR